LLIIVVSRLPDAVVAGYCLIAQALTLNTSIAFLRPTPTVAFPGHVYFFIWQSQRATSKKDIAICKSKQDRTIDSNIEKDLPRSHQQRGVATDRRYLATAAWLAVFAAWTDGHEKFAALERTVEPRRVRIPLALRKLRKQPRHKR
jgi:hypothetical protein